MNFNSHIRIAAVSKVNHFGRHSVCTKSDDGPLAGTVLKEVMNVVGNTGMNENTNVVPLFSTVQVEMPDPLQELLDEAQAEAWEEDEEMPVIKANRLLVSENQFPDQSIFVLEQQLSSLNESMARLKFYLGDLDDLLPR